MYLTPQYMYDPPFVHPQVIIHPPPGHWSITSPDRPMTPPLVPTPTPPPFYVSPTPTPTPQHAHPSTYTTCIDCNLPPSFDPDYGLTEAITLSCSHFLCFTCWEALLLKLNGMGDKAFPRFVTKSLSGLRPRAVYARQTPLLFRDLGFSLPHESRPPDVFSDWTHQTVQEGTESNRYRGTGPGERFGSVNERSSHHRVVSGQLHDAQTPASRPFPHVQTSRGVLGLDAPDCQEGTESNEYHGTGPGERVGSVNE